MPGVKARFVHGLRRTAQRLESLRAPRRNRSEADLATAYWARLVDYHETNDAEEIGQARSRWLADEIVTGFGISSLLEVGTNSGRNLAAIRVRHPTMRLAGTDVNS